MKIEETHAEQILIDDEEDEEEEEAEVVEEDSEEDGGFLKVEHVEEEAEEEEEEKKSDDASKASSEQEEVGVRMEERETGNLLVVQEQEDDDDIGSEAEYVTMETAAKTDTASPIRVAELQPEHRDFDNNNNDRFDDDNIPEQTTPDVVSVAAAPSTPLDSEDEDAETRVSKLDNKEEDEEEEDSGGGGGGAILDGHDVTSASCSSENLTSFSLSDASRVSTPSTTTTRQEITMVRFTIRFLLSAVYFIIYAKASS